MMKIILTIALCLVAHFAEAAISNFPWSTTFNYAECTQRGALGQTDCATVQNDGLTWNWGANGVYGLYYAQVNSAANNPSGGGGNGFRGWNGDGDNSQSAPVAAVFSNPQPELWIRHYIRFQEGFNWSTQHYDKWLYIRTRPYPENHSNQNLTITGSGSGTFYVVSSAPVPASNMYGTLTWNSLMGGPYSNGEWICAETYLKMDTDGTNGKVKLWINGTLVMSRDNVNFSGGDTVSRQGWQWFDFENNQNAVANAVGPIGANIAYVDYDDFAVYNTPPPNTDAAGNPFIGPIGWGSPPDTAAPTCTTFATAPTSQSLTVPITWDCTDNNKVTGWYLSESPNAPGSTGWLSQKPTSFTVGGTGTRTIYAWVRDAADNRSAGRSSTTVVTEDQAPPSPGSTKMGISGKTRFSPVGLGVLRFQ